MAIDFFSPLGQGFPDCTAGGEGGHPGLGSIGQQTSIGHKAQGCQLGRVCLRDDLTVDDGIHGTPAGADDAGCKAQEVAGLGGFEKADIMDGCGKDLKVFAVVAIVEDPVIAAGAGGVIHIGDYVAAVHGVIGV